MKLCTVKFHVGGGGLNGTNRGKESCILMGIRVRKIQERGTRERESKCMD